MTTNTHNLFERDSGYSLQEQLALLAEVTQSFAHSLDIDDTLKNALQRFMDYLNAEASSIFLLENNNTELVCRGCAGPVDITGLRLPAGKGIVGITVTSKSVQMIRDVSKDPNFAQQVDKDTGFVTRSILCAPLIVQDRCIGALELINKRSGNHLFDVQDQHLIIALASAASLAIHNARMADKLVVQERMQKELELAREIQEDLLPESPCEDFPVIGINIPAREVSGDFYDFFQRGDGLIYFNLADVSGKGMNAAIVMAKASSLLHHLAKLIDDPGELLAHVNDEICESVSHGMFVTLVSGFFNPETGEVSLANAGHQPPLYHDRHGRFREIPAEAPPIGIIPGTVFPVTTIPLDGGSLYIFTDGVTEAVMPDNRQLGVPGLEQLIEHNGGYRTRHKLDRIITALRSPGIGQHDDITLLVIDGKR
jgi:sigma-B regulation protein RsbU (phosphoserine phosphatase)